MEGTTIFAGIRVVQGRDFGIDLDMQEYVEDNVASMDIPKERRDNPGAAATKSELSEFRGCAGTLQRLHFFSFPGVSWKEVPTVQYADASPSNRPRGFSTGGLLTLLVGPSFRKGLEAPANVLAWRSFKLPRKVAGSNGGESQTLSFAEEAQWLVRLAWAEVHGTPLIRHQLHEAVRQISGALVTDSRGIYDASVKSESPQKGLRSPQSGVELEMACDDALRCGTILRWSHGGAMLADTLAKRSALARRTFELFLSNNQRWRLVYDPKFQSERRRTRAGLARLVDFDLAKQEDCKDVDVSALCIFYESADRPTITVKLAMEDGCAKIPDTAEI